MGLGEITAFKIEDTGIAGIVEPVTIGADAVDPYRIALILDGAGDEQLFPGVASAGGEIGGINQEVKGVGISAPDGEAQVVADQWADFPSIQFDEQSVLSGAVVEVFS